MPTRYHNFGRRVNTIVQLDDGRWTVTVHTGRMEGAYQAIGIRLASTILPKLHICNIVPSVLAGPRGFGAFVSKLPKDSFRTMKLRLL